AIELAQRALAVVDADRAGGTVATARATLVKAYAARARDARHGVGQLSLGAQRAPTRDDCDDGWRRVEDIVGVAEAAAAEAARLALLLDDPAASDLARAADAAAQDARRIVRERNHAYTFHADPGFSFGEGWYLAAAAVLTGVAIQIEPDKPQTSQAQRFVRDAGLDPLVQPYRSRPSADCAPRFWATSPSPAPSSNGRTASWPAPPRARRCCSGSGAARITRDA